VNGQSDGVAEVAELWKVIPEMKALNSDLSFGRYQQQAAADGRFVEWPSIGDIWEDLA
jgi:hypothetical protein